MKKRLEIQKPEVSPQSQPFRFEKLVDKTTEILKTVKNWKGFYGTPTTIHCISSIIDKSLTIINNFLTCLKVVYTIEVKSYDLALFLELEKNEKFFVSDNNFGMMEVLGN